MEINIFTDVKWCVEIVGSSKICVAENFKDAHEKCSQYNSWIATMADGGHFKHGIEWALISIYDEYASELKHVEWNELI